MWKLTLFLLLAMTSALDWTALDDVIREAITDHVFPGASITVANDKQILYRGNYGSITYKHDIF
jgi:hypothetical protein